MASKAEDRAGMTDEKFPPRTVYGSYNGSAGVMATEPYLSLAEHDHIVSDLRAKLKVAEEALIAIRKECRLSEESEESLDWARSVPTSRVDYEVEYLARNALSLLRGESGVE